MDSADLARVAINACLLGTGLPDPDGKHPYLAYVHLSPDGISASNRYLMLSVKMETGVPHRMFLQAKDVSPEGINIPEYPREWEKDAIDYTRVLPSEDALADAARWKMATVTGADLLAGKVKEDIIFVDKPSEIAFTSWEGKVFFDRAIWSKLATAATMYERAATGSEALQFYAFYATEGLVLMNAGGDFRAMIAPLRK